MTIAETRIGNDCIYIAVEDSEDIRDLYIRKADCRRSDVFLRMYVPPQLWDRISTLNKLCSEKRLELKDIKTQLRYGQKDVEILVKEKGSQEPFRLVDMREFLWDADIPSFDHSVKWRRQVERTSRRRVSSSRSSSPRNSPSSRQQSSEGPPITKQLRKLSLKETECKKT